MEGPGECEQEDDIDTEKDEIKVGDDVPATALCERRNSMVLREIVGRVCSRNLLIMHCHSCPCHLDTQNVPEDETGSTERQDSAQEYASMGWACESFRPSHGLYTELHFPSS